jgi:hypothetical protein
MVHKKARTLQSPNDFNGLTDGQARHKFLDFDFHEFDGSRARFERDFFTVFQQTFEVATNGVFHHCAGFFKRISFGYESWECRHCHYVTALFGGLKNRCVLIIRHVDMLSGGRFLL